MAAESAKRPGLRERKKQETREALSMAAIRLIAERGWRSVTEEDIAEAANVSVRTFRNYFSGKGEAVAARHVDRVRRIADGLLARPDEEPFWQAVRAAVLEQFAPEYDIEAHPQDPRRNDGVRLMLTEPALRGEIAKAHAAAETELAAAIAERTGTDAEADLYPKLAAAAIGAAIGAAIDHYLNADPPIAPVAALRDALDRITAGLPVP
jgi:AcrR family transcriptional regulator